MRRDENAIPEGVVGGLSGKGSGYFRDKQWRDVEKRDNLTGPGKSGNVEGGQWAQPLDETVSERNTWSWWGLHEFSVTELEVV